MTSPPEDKADPKPVPRLPRKWGWKFAVPDLIRIGFFAALLVAVIATRETCANGVSTFMGTFESAPDAGLKLERLTPEQIKRRYPGVELPTATDGSK